MFVAMAVPMVMVSVMAVVPVIVAVVFLVHDYLFELVSEKGGNGDIRIFFHGDYGLHAV